MGPPDNQDPAAERGIFLFLRRGIRGLWPLDPGSGAYREDEMNMFLGSNQLICNRLPIDLRFTSDGSSLCLLLQPLADACQYY